jgi:alkanesulfonate monooxygenase SsuD/methylene tetrahydromethanopterin reductase-like flavin-dependent oxidoreductase (luciferase family)
LATRGAHEEGYVAARTTRARIASGILQLYSRTPTLLAMTAVGLDDVSDGRFELGIGTSGPQVHRATSARPGQRARQAAHDDRPPPFRNRIPITVAAIGPRNIALTAEHAEGWVPPFYVPEKAADVWGESLRGGFAKCDKDLGPLDVQVGASVTGPEGYVLDRPSALAESGVTTLAVRPVAQDHATRLRLIEQVRGLIDRL